MKELIFRLFKRPVLAAEILISTFFITLLTLAMPLYVIQILNRYVTYGFHGTLITLTAGMLMAVFLQLVFRILRTKMATIVNQAPNDRLSLEVLDIISRAKAEPLDQFSKPRIQETLNHVQTVQKTYDAQTVNTVVDAPFSLLLIAVIYLLSPLLSGLALTGIMIGLFTGWLGTRQSQQDAEQLVMENARHRAMTSSAVNALDTVRAFGAAAFLHKIWQDQVAKISRRQKKITDFKEISQTLTLSGSSLTSVFLYAVGATLVVQGKLTVGALIGANILASRAYQNTTRLVPAGYMLGKAKKALRDIALMQRLPMEPDSGSALRVYKGRVEFQDVGFAYPGMAHPVFESLSFTIPPGTAMAVVGQNGTGKTTLAKLLMGLLEPRRGSILADDVNVQQLAWPWWRKQIIYMPQEPSFLTGTIRENIVFLDPDLDEALLNHILRASDVKPFLDQATNGLDTLLTDNGKNLPPGIRRRLSLARGLVTNGQIVVLDEPTDALDETGRLAVYKLMNDLMKVGKTIVVFSNDPKILKGVTTVLNLNIKPAPEIIHKPLPEVKGD
ncbi:MAG: ATP-binding cassette domain-containing protein [Desulfotignum sp.]|nr:ATP-binding cassette domain-containing protein [Desulfotignum sp.]MCF8088558.1 ATP-binding cassette domain-containing protein [Desulfotignum sp.]MCF8137948.1 ATP-binding cassette domain-containing protein [Desulfotignum sp.]